ncbi:cysteine hydrolase [Corynebacterium hindlerae]|uniref:cysteine hydrolase family protein n=1 Tax=Corynebacterium hindlerae TaxID=699041 RepID=UPI001AD6EA59|nr:cysteine hydrolase [Corynebacterium hindlerae]QTH59740.1 cysteine hydrolase [Corynebacterium hindlerae]
MNEKTAILAIHLIGDIVADGTAFGRLFYPEVVRREVIARCNAAFSKVRDAGGTVVAVRVAFREDYSDLAPHIPLLVMAQQAGALKDGSPGAEIVDDVELLDSDIVLTHTRPGPFSSSNLETLLKEQGIENVIVCGVATNASVESTVRESADLGFNTFLLEDACSAATRQAHEAAVESMRLFAQVITTADL